MNELKERTVAEIVSENIKAAHVFKKYGIDFCCGGGVSVAKACEKKGVNIEALSADIAAIGNNTFPSHNFNGWELDFLSEYIINTHHVYVSENIPLTLQYAEKVAKVHGNASPELYKILELFKIVAAELHSHMQKEEQILFPYIKQLVQVKKTNSTMNVPPFGSAKNPIRMMEMEHEKAGDLLKEIAVLSKQYTTPDWACNTYKALFAKLEEFEDDLHQHVHLENNILFPKAILMEESIAN
ncbi:MAG: iron-sulfur cluster repair di-iron protein [Bacteroidia bacterium]|nr:iron-sulfur cluster repair di-iron protein [Bacteroidia bacterium]